MTQDNLYPIEQTAVKKLLYRVHFNFRLCLKYVLKMEYYFKI